MAGMKRQARFFYLNELVLDIIIGCEHVIFVVLIELHYVRCKQLQTFLISIYLFGHVLFY